uniref:Uncharacterized protein n=1 Tax=Ditylenchus dipsaci TaxID=166011 RepID=A0A915DLA3_9BILA
MLRSCSAICRKFTHICCSVIVVYYILSFHSDYVTNQSLLKRVSDVVHNQQQKHSKAIREASYDFDGEATSRNDAEYRGPKRRHDGDDLCNGGLDRKLLNRSSALCLQML